VGADRIGHHVELAPSTVQRILNDAGCGRLDVGDRATATRREVRSSVASENDLGELAHLDVKKLSGIPTGGGWRQHGRGIRILGDNLPIEHN
jgi:hypothetical protein